MNKTTLLSNFKYIALGLVLATGLSLVHADFPLPTAVAPGANVAVPLHTGPDQVKDGGLSVNTFYALQNAQFKQQTFLNGVVRGGSPTSKIASSTVVIGDANAPANISVTGGLSAVSNITNQSVQNTNSSNLCANATGTIVLCGKPVDTTPLPTIPQIGPTTVSNGNNRQIFGIGDSIETGDVYSLAVYGLNVTVTAGAGDTPEIIGEKLIYAVNNINAATWGAARYGATAGYKPSASSSPSNPAYIITIVDPNNKFTGTASRPTT